MTWFETQIADKAVPTSYLSAEVADDAAEKALELRLWKPLTAGALTLV